MKSSADARNLALVTCALALLCSCDMPKKSRFDDIAGVDVCALITTAEAEHILGPLETAKRGTNAAQGFAGECTWSFKVLATSGQGTLYAMMTTRASSPHGYSVEKYFELSQPEIEASLGATPWKMEGLGDKAFLYQTRQPDHSELMLLQSETLLTLRMMGGSAAQLEEFARALSRELEPKK